jgi:ABC-2 type transport system ATP-binding protein
MLLRKGGPVMASTLNCLPAPGFNNDNGAWLRAGSLLVEAIGLSKSYGGHLVLDNVTLRIRAGEIAGLLGPNGAGKTTTLSILATLLCPDSGELRVAGVDPRRDAASIRHKLGFVPQSIALFPSLSPLQNLELFGRVQGIAKGQARAAAMRMLEMVGLAERARDPVAILSGGMNRRLNLACAMVHSPQLLLLDEPTTGVDPQSRERIFATVRKAAEAGAAVIYSTHYMEEAERLCDRLLLIDHGRLIANGTVSELIALGGTQARMEIDFQTEPPTGWLNGMLGISELPAESGMSKTILPLANLNQAAEVLERARSLGAHVQEFSVHRPNLSDAFIALTGHALRDPEPQ